MSKRVRKYTKSNPASFISSKIWQVIELTIGQKVTPRPIRGQYNDVTAAINRGCQRGQCPSLWMNLGLTTSPGRPPTDTSKLRSSAARWQKCAMPRTHTMSSVDGRQGTIGDTSRAPGRLKRSSLQELFSLTLVGEEWPYFVSSGLCLKLGLRIKD